MKLLKISSCFIVAILLGPFAIIGFICHQVASAFVDGWTFSYKCIEAFQDWLD